jgi:two-component system phosphate regulon sensor histidine kinase PhoR
MIESSYKKILAVQVIVWPIFYLISATLLNVHFGINLDHYFIVRYSLLIIFFFGINVWLIYYLSRPKVEELEEKIFFDQKEFFNLKDTLEVENRLYRILVDSLEDPVCVITSPKKEVFFINHKFNQFFKLKEATLPLPSIEISRNLTFQNFINESIDENKAHYLNDFSFDDSSDPRKIYFNIKIIPIKFSSHFLCIFHDITERKLSDQIREDFISNFSHEIRTPLTILNGQVQNLKNFDFNDSKNNNLIGFLNKIENNSRRLTSLFDDMLSLTSIEKQKDLNIEEFDIEPVIYNITQDLEIKHLNKKSKFILDIKQNKFRGDYNLTEQVIINLVDNAIKYSTNQNTDAIIKISTKQEENYNLIIVEDNGIGIHEDQRHRIFERFFRIDISRSSEISGTGLGLAIVKHIVQKHHGKIKVTSTIGIGTQFTISLPI